MSKGSKSYDYTLTKMPRPSSSYSENGVRMMSIGNREGPRAALLPIEEQETSVSDIQLRVNSNDDGIIVGVTLFNLTYPYNECLLTKQISLTYN
jgi:hypothetical protein